MNVLAEVLRALAQVGSGYGAATAQLTLQELEQRRQEGRNIKQTAAEWRQTLASALANLPGDSPNREQLAGLLAQIEQVVAVPDEDAAETWRQLQPQLQQALPALTEAQRFVAGRNLLGSLASQLLPVFLDPSRPQEVKEQIADALATAIGVPKDVFAPLAQLGQIRQRPWEAMTTEERQALAKGLAMGVAEWSNEGGVWTPKGWRDEQLRQQYEAILQKDPSIAGLLSEAYSALVTNTATSRGAQAQADIAELEARFLNTTFAERVRQLQNQGKIQDKQIAQLEQLLQRGELDNQKAQLELQRMGLDLETARQLAPHLVEEQKLRNRSLELQNQRIESLLPYEVEQAQWQTVILGSEARVATATEGARIRTAEAQAAASETEVAIRKAQARAAEAEAVIREAQAKFAAEKERLQTEILQITREREATALETDRLNKALLDLELGLKRKLAPVQARAALFEYLQLGGEKAAHILPEEVLKAYGISRQNAQNIGRMFDQLRKDEKYYNLLQLVDRITAQRYTNPADIEKELVRSGLMSPEDAKTWARIFSSVNILFDREHAYRMSSLAAATARAGSNTARAGSGTRAPGISADDVFDFLGKQRLMVKEAADAVLAQAKAEKCVIEDIWRPNASDVCRGLYAQYTELNEQLKLLSSIGTVVMQQLGLFPTRTQPQPEPQPQSAPQPRTQSQPRPQPQLTSPSPSVAATMALWNNLRPYQGKSPTELKRTEKTQIKAWVFSLLQGGGTTEAELRKSGFGWAIDELRKEGRLK